MSSTEHKRDEDMSRAYHAASHDDPPAALDDAIRAAARRAVHARPHTAKNPWLPRWGSPIAAAAVVMLAVSMLFVAVDERPEIAPPALQVSLPKSSPPAVQLPATESGPAEARDQAAVAPATSGRIEEKPPAATTTVMAKAVPTPSKTTAAQQQSPSAISSSVGFEARRDAAAPMRESAIIVAPENLAKPAPVPAPAAAFPAAPLATPAAAPPQFVAGQMAERARDEAVQLNQESKRMMAKSAALASGTAATREMRQDVNKKDASDTTIVSTQSMAPSAYAPPAASPAQEPNAWLKRIEELRVQGKLKEAREELVRFRKQYPKIELPKALAEMPAE